jgi:hypothetical protein
MPIDHGVKVRTKDGHEAGQVKHAIWDPTGTTITEYVVSTGGLLGHDVVVSPELLQGTARHGNEIVLTMTKHEVDELAHYEPAEYTTPPAEWVAPTVSGFPAGGHLFPVTEREMAHLGEPLTPSDEAGRESETAGRESHI